MQLIVLTCCGPSASSLICTARRCRGSASAGRPRSCRQQASPVMLGRVLGCCGPRVCSLACSVRRCSDSASVCRPMASKQLARRCALIKVSGCCGPSVCSMPCIARRCSGSASACRPMSARQRARLSTMISASGSCASMRASRGPAMAATSILSSSWCVLVLLGHACDVTLHLFQAGSGCMQQNHGIFKSSPWSAGSRRHFLQQQHWTAMSSSVLSDSSSLSGESESQVTEL